MEASLLMQEVVSAHRARLNAVILWHDTVSRHTYCNDNLRPRKPEVQKPGWQTQAMSQRGYRMEIGGYSRLIDSSALMRHEGRWSQWTSHAFRFESGASLTGPRA